MPRRTLWNRRIPLPDGAEIAADVVLPPGDGPFPVVLKRSPYGRTRYFDQGRLSFVDKGYALVVTDMRGRGDSTGRFQPFVKDPEDAYHVVEWAGTQPWSTGKVGMIGSSYDGLSQWWSAMGKPPHLACIIPKAVGFVRFDERPMSGTGVPSQYWAFWFTMVTGRTWQNTGAPSWDAVMDHRPLRTWDEHLGTTSSAWRDYVEGKAEYLSPDFGVSPDELAKLDLPVMVGVGWWDDQTAMDNWIAIRRSKGADKARLLIGAWDHPGNQLVRPVLGGLDVSASVIDQYGYMEQFLAQHLKGAANAFASQPRAHVFRTGEMVWEDLDDWPAASEQQAWYLHSRGGAQTMHGDGFLSLEAPGDEPADTYVHDPLTPVRSMVGMSSWGERPLDHRYLHRQENVLVYTSQPFEAPLRVSGRAELELHLSSDRPDTDVFVSLADVYPDGRAISLGGGGSLRLRYRSGPDPEPLKPGEMTRAVIPANWLHHTFLPGHRLRIALYSSSYGSAINFGTGAHWADETEPHVATNSVHHSSTYPSCLWLPVEAR